MKLPYAQLKSHLARNLSPIYIIAGDDWWLKQDAVKLIRQAAKKADFHERISLTVDAKFDWAHFYSLVYSSSLMAEKRIIQLKLNDTLPNKAASEMLAAYAKEVSPHHLLLIEMEKVEAKTAKAAWFQALEKAGHLVAIWPIAREDLPRFIMERAGHYKLNLSREAALLLTDYVEGNLAASAQMLEKLYLLQQTGPIDAACIESIANNDAVFTVFDFIDSLIAGNRPRSLHVLERLQADATEPTLILWSITRELRLLAEFAQKMAQGERIENLFQKQRVFSRRQGIIRQFLSKHSAGDCWALLTHAANIDKLIKGALTGDVWLGLQLFCLRWENVNHA